MSRLCPLLFEPKRLRDAPVVVKLGGRVKLETQPPTEPETSPPGADDGK